jgi:hypothetical protein
LLARTLRLRRFFPTSEDLFERVFGLDDMYPKSDGDPLFV